MGRCHLDRLTGDNPLSVGSAFAGVTLRNRLVKASKNVPASKYYPIISQIRLESSSSTGSKLTLRLRYATDDQTRCGKSHDAIASAEWTHPNWKCFEKLLLFANLPFIFVILVEFLHDKSEVMLVLRFFFPFFLNFDFSTRTVSTTESFFFFFWMTQVKHYKTKV